MTFKTVSILTFLFLWTVVNPAFADKRDHLDYNDNTFIHGIKLNIEDELYYFRGPADGANGEQDSPGHSWVQFGNRLIGKIHNTGPFGEANGWSPDQADGALLYILEARIDSWNELKAAKYYAKGYTHYHRIVRVDNGEPHPQKVVWIKHVAVSHFYLVPRRRPELAHWVAPGIDFEFVTNWNQAYGVN
ncbi:MAG: hypothetical protein OEY38_07715 [Gammaproteobacteria bacterium]|nr:hypothetical protein [Gammaproteobacteria bacterium]